MKKARLSNVEILFLQLEAHMRFICPECGESFQTQQVWRQHLNFHHDYLCKSPENLGFIEIDERYHECTECNQLVADGKKAIALLQYHRFLHLPHKYTYHCRHCDGEFMRKRVCFEHLCRNHHDMLGSKLVEQAIKSQILGNKKVNSNPRNSIAKDNPEFYFRCICPQCGIRLNTLKRMLDHIDQKHNILRSDYGMLKVTGTDENYCNICKKLVNSSNREILQRHYFTHLPYKLNFQCTYCHVRRPFKTEILHHFMRTHIQEFEKHRIYMKKPKEFGAEILNENLDKELDLLLQHGNRVGSPNWTKYASTTVKHKTQKNFGSSLSSRKEKTVKNDILQTAIDNSFIDLEKDSNSKQIDSTTDAESVNRSSNIKKELDALCAEIFKDLDDEPTPTESTTEFVNNNLLQKSLQEAANNDNNNTLNDEQIVSIEIDTLDEHELNEINEKDESDNMESVSQSAKRRKLNDASSMDVVNNEIFPNFKSLYIEKVQHLCPQCGESFTDQTLWRDHVLKKHEDTNKSINESFQHLDNANSYLCLTCKSILLTTQKTELQRHRFSHMPYMRYLKCTICSKCKTNKSKMMEHLENNHSSLVKKQVYTASDLEQTRNCASIVKNKNQFLGSNGSNTKNNDFIPILTHLQNARARLNRMAAEYGLAQF